MSIIGLMKVAGTAELKPLPDYGDHMTMNAFIDCCESGAFINYDGYGNYATIDQTTSLIVTPSDVTSGKVDKSYTHVVWYNR